jgi:hypothetical protein
MKISYLSLSALLVGVLLLPASVFAATTTATPVVVIATVNIYNAKIVSQSGRAITIAFDLTNREGIQPGVKYGVSLTQSKPTGQVVADEKVFDEVLTLGAGANIHKEITYTVPEQISGTYDLFISSRNTDGLSLGAMLLGIVTFYPSTQGLISIDPSSCYATVKGDVKNIHYSSIQGVDIAEAETLEAHCAVSNTTKEAVTLTPSFSTYYRNIYGAIVAASGGDTASVSLAPNEQKVLVFALPKAAVPQAYEVTLSLSAEGKVVSNAVKFRYVLRGASATIQNVTWDKESYQQGDTATVSFFWTPSADISPEARAQGTPLSSPTVEISMTDEHGVACGAPVMEALSSGASLVSLKIITTAICVHPRLSATIKDATHGVLATGNFRTVTSAAPVAPVSASDESSDNTGLIIVLVIFIIGVVLFFVMKQKGKGTTGIPPAAGVMLLALMLTGGMFSATPSAHADTWNTTGNAIYTTSLNQTSYTESEEIEVSGRVDRGTSGNAVNVDLAVNVDGVVVKTAQGNFTDSYGPGTNPLYMVLSNGALPAVGETICKYLPAPSGVSDHFIDFGAFNTSMGVNQLTFYQMPFTVTGAPVIPPPVVTLTKNPNTPTVVSGTQGFVTWSVTNNPYACSFDRNGITIASGLPASMTDYPVGAITADTTFQLRCVNGSSGGASVTFNITPLVPSATISATNCIIASGASTCNSSVTWNISNATSPNVKQAGTQFSAAVSGTQSRPVSNGATAFTANDGATQLNAASASGSCTGGTSWNGTSCAALNTPPNAPTIGGPTTGLPSTSYNFTFTATDPDLDTIHYEIDWDNNGTVDQTLPAVFIPSGATRSQTNNWAGVGVKTFKARTVDSRGGVSGWTSHTITIDAPPVLSVIPTNVDFGTVVVNEVKDGTTMNATWITITNTGGGTLTGALDFASAPNFSCAPFGNCTFSLTSGASQVAKIRLTAPATPGPLGAEIVMVNSNGGNQPVTVSGMVIPVISINPGPLDFGSVILKKCSVDKALTINNNSSTVNVPSGSISVAAPFACSTSCDYPAIPPGGSAVIMMRYCPTALGAQTGVGTLNMSPVIEDNTGDLIGTGLPLTFNVQER